MPGHADAVILILARDTGLHPLEVTSGELPGRQPIFERGRLDRFARSEAGEEAFRELRPRPIAEDATATGGGLVTDMGSMASFRAPDDGWHEVVRVEPGGAECGLKRPPSS